MSCVFYQSEHENVGTVLFSMYGFSGLASGHPYHPTQTGTVLQQGHYEIKMEVELGWLAAVAIKRSN